MKVLWIELGTTSLDPQVAHIIELAYIPQINGEFDPKGITYEEILPTMIEDDHLLKSSASLDSFLNYYNNKGAGINPRKTLEIFKFEEDSPLFMYAKEVALMNRKLKTPESWIIGKNKKQPKQAIKKLMEMLLSIKDKERWVLAGHCVEYDYNVLMMNAIRCLSKEEYEEFNSLFSNWHLNTMAFSRFYSAFGKFNPSNFSLENVCTAVGIGYPKVPDSKNVLETEIALVKQMFAF